MPLVSGLLLVLLCVVQRAVCDCAASAHTSDSQESGSGAPTCTSAGSISSAGGDAEAASSSPPQLPREAAIFGVEVPGDATPQKPANAKKPVYKLQIGVRLLYSLIITFLPVVNTHRHHRIDFNCTQVKYNLIVCKLSF